MSELLFTDCVSNYCSDALIEKPLNAKISFFSIVLIRKLFEVAF